MREPKRLPFTLDTVTSIRPDASPNHCRVTYLPDGEPSQGGKKTMRVAFDDMEQFCHTFERCLRVAVILADELHGRGNTIRDMIRMWSHQRPQSHARHHNILRSPVRSTSWIKPCDFAFGFQAATDVYGMKQEPVPVCVAVWKDDNDDKNVLRDYRILDANFPGFSDLCKVICIENSLSGDQAFEILGMLGDALPFAELKEKTGVFKEMLRAYVPIGMTPAEIGASILSNLAEPAGRALPDLNLTLM
jgi:hypothetical protein